MLGVGGKVEIVEDVILNSHPMEDKVYCEDRKVFDVDFEVFLNKWDLKLGEGIP